MPIGLLDLIELGDPAKGNHQIEFSVKKILHNPRYVFFLQEKMPNEMRHSIHAGRRR